MGLEPSPRFEAVSDLSTNGWEGLAILSDRPEVLERLCGGGPRAAAAGRQAADAARKMCPPGLFAKLAWGRPFAGLARFARDRGIPAAAVAEPVFLDDSDERLYPLLRAIDLNTTLEHVPAAERPEARHRYSPPEAVARFFSAVPEALANTESLLERATCDGIISPRFVFPSFQGMSDEEAFRELRRLCEEGAVRRYGCMRPDVRQRLEHELAIIREKGFASYFLVVRDIVQQCPRTCGRGSAASSIVSYLLSLTHVEPLRYNLFFERFLNRGRNDPPDIDVDFPWDEREAVQRYVFRAYEGRAGMVANHVTFGPRSALRDPAKALGMPAEEIGSVVRFFRLGEHEPVPRRTCASRRAPARLPAQPRHALRRGRHHPGADHRLHPPPDVAARLPADRLGEGRHRGRGARQDRPPGQPLARGAARHHRAGGPAARRRAPGLGALRPARGRSHRRPHRAAGTPWACSTSSRRPPGQLLTKMGRGDYPEPRDRQLHHPAGGQPLHHALS